MTDTSTSGPDDTQLEYAAYLEERRYLVQAAADQFRSFDKAILTLAAGALGISLTFFKDIVPSLRYGTDWLLYFGWTTLVGSMLLTLCSFQTGASALRRQISILDDGQRMGTLSDKQKQNIPGDCTYVLNWASLIVFIVGAAFLTVFVAANAYQQKAGSP